MEIIYLSLHCHHQNVSCSKMGSDESRFVSLTVKDKVTRQHPQTTTFEGKARKVDLVKDKSPAAPSSGLEPATFRSLACPVFYPPNCLRQQAMSFRPRTTSESTSEGPNTNECLFILKRTHSMQIFGEILFMKPQNDT